MEDLKSHLMEREFALVFNNMPNEDDKNDLIALQLMCVVDFQAEEKNLYKRIAETGQLKLLSALMGFRSYESFIYYDYQGHQQLDDKNLKCRYCELFGPYVLILTHMTINHDEHKGLVKCAYCNHTDLKKHFSDGSLQACYERYLRKPDMVALDLDDFTLDIIKDFYGFLRTLSITLGVHTRRQLHHFTGSGFGGDERSAKRNARAASCSFEVIHRQRKSQKFISTEKLSMLANDVWVKIHGEPLPNECFAQNQIDNGTRERPARLNHRRNATNQYDNAESSDEQLNRNESEPNANGPRIFRAYSVGEATNTSSATLPDKTAESKFGEYVAHRLELQAELAKRRRLEAEIQKTIFNFEINELEK